MSRKSVLWCMGLTTSLFVIVMPFLFLPYYIIVWSGKSLGSSIIQLHPIYASILHQYPDYEFNSLLIKRFRAEWPGPKDLIIRRVRNWQQDLKQAEWASALLTSGDGFAIDEAEYRTLESAVLASNSENIAIHVTAHLMFDVHRAKDNEALFTAMSKSSNHMVAEIGRLRLGTP